MPVSGVVITCTPGVIETLTPLINAESGVEVHGAPDDSTIIAVIEAETVQDEVDTVKRLFAMHGVQSVRLAYHNFEDPDEGDIATDSVRKES